MSLCEKRMSRIQGKKTHNSVHSEERLYLQPLHYQWPRGRDEQRIENPQRTPSPLWQRFQWSISEKWIQHTLEYWDWNSGVVKIDQVHRLLSLTLNFCKGLSVHLPLGRRWAAANPGTHTILPHLVCSPVNNETVWALLAMQKRYDLMCKWAGNLDREWWAGNLDGECLSSTWPTQWHDDF